MRKHTVSTAAKLLLTLMALLLLSVPASARIDNCCFVDRHCTTNYEWVNGYYAFQYNHCVAPAGSQQQSTAPLSQPQSETREENDNCCFIGWQCDTDEEWTSGYYAFQNNQCNSQPHGQAQQQRQSQPRQDQQSPSENNNCCFSGWQCNTDEEWNSGYFAFQHDQCDSPAQWQGLYQQMRQQQRQEQQRQRQSGDLLAPGDRPRPQAQSSQNRNSATVGDEPGSYQATLDLSNPGDSEHELEDGTVIIIGYGPAPSLTCPGILEVYPDWPYCLGSRP